VGRGDSEMQSSGPTVGRKMSSPGSRVWCDIEYSSLSATSAKQEATGWEDELVGWFAESRVNMMMSVGCVGKGGRVGSTREDKTMDCVIERATECIIVRFGSEGSLRDNPMRFPTVKWGDVKEAIYGPNSGTNPRRDRLHANRSPSLALLTTRSNLCDARMSNPPNPRPFASADTQ